MLHLTLDCVRHRGERGWVWCDAPQGCHASGRGPMPGLAYNDGLGFELFFVPLQQALCGTLFGVLPRAAHQARQRAAGRGGPRGSAHSS